jgi:hypothetical protein
MDSALVKELCTSREAGGLNTPILCVHAPDKEEILRSILSDPVQSPLEAEEACPSHPKNE